MTGNWPASASTSCGVSASGRRRSRKTRSGSRSAKMTEASAQLCAPSTSKPMSPICSTSSRLNTWSSSTTSISFFMTLFAHSRQLDTESASRPGDARHGDRSAITLDDALADGQAKAGATLAISAMAVERIENPRLCFLRNAAPLIDHLDHGLLTCQGRAHQQGAAVRHCVMGILDQIQHQHTQVALVGQYTRLTGIKYQG